MSQISVEQLCSDLPYKIIAEYFIDHIASKYAENLSFFLDILMLRYPLDFLLSMEFPQARDYFINYVLEKGRQTIDYFSQFSEAIPADTIAPVPAMPIETLYADSSACPEPHQNIGSEIVSLFPFSATDQNVNFSGSDLSLNMQVVDSINQTSDASLKLNPHSKVTQPAQDSTRVIKKPLRTVKNKKINSLLITAKENFTAAIATSGDLELEQRSAAPVALAENMDTDQPLHMTTQRCLQPAKRKLDEEQSLEFQINKQAKPGSPDSARVHFHP